MIQCLDGNKLTYHVKRELPAVLNVVLFPTKLNVEHLPTVHSVSVRADTDVLATGFTVKSNGITDTFLISDDGFANDVNILKRMKKLNLKVNICFCVEINS